MGESRIMADTKVIYGIIGLIMLSGVGLILLTPEQLDAASTCTTNNITGIFEKFSATNITAYWTLNGTQKQSVCTKGKWIPTRQWMLLNNVSEKDILIKAVNESAYTETGIEIVDETKPIIITKSTQLSIEGKVYNITYKEKPPVIKCICDIKTGCAIQECLK